MIEEPGGAEHFLRAGEPLGPDGLDRLRQADAILKGPVGLPHVRRPDGTEGGLLGGVLRRGLDTFANVRPVRLHPGIQGTDPARPRGDIDYVIVRENTEGLYLSRGNGVATPAAASDQLMITRDGHRRVVTFAFELARRRARVGRAPARVTCVDKSNVLRSFALFRAVFEETAADYPDVETDCLYADAAAHALAARPERFDVLVMENFLGRRAERPGAGNRRWPGHVRVGQHRGGSTRTSSRSTAAPPASRGRTAPTRCPRSSASP